MIETASPSDMVVNSLIVAWEQNRARIAAGYR